MSNKLWTWFKKVAHYVAVGVADAEKFLQAAGALNLIPGSGLVATGVGVFERILGVTKDIEVAWAGWSDPNVPSGAQKLQAATPGAVQALMDFMQAAGLKTTDPVAFQALATKYASLGADFWNIVEPKNGVNVPTPNVPAPTTPNPILAAKPA